jgi:hypothetical protein
MLGLMLALAGCGDEESPTPDDPDKADASKDAGRDGRVSERDTGPKDAGPADPKLEPLAGRYLLRLDTLGTAMSPSPLGGSLRIRSRVSNLIVAELSVEGDHLVGKERVCTQAVEQRCDEGCATASTVVDSRTISGFLLKQFQQREYTLSGDGTFTGGRSVATLGYTGDVDAPSPSSPDDKRIWDVDPSTPLLEGFLTKLKLTVQGVPIGVECLAYGTQKFVSAFSGKLGGTGSAPEFPEMPVDLDGSEANALGASSMACNSDGVETPIDESNARMVRYGDELSDDAFWNCPTAAVFDKELPPTAL